MQALRGWRDPDSNRRHHDFRHLYKSGVYPRIGPDVTYAVHDMDAGGQVSNPASRRIFSTSFRGEEALTSRLSAGSRSSSCPTPPRSTDRL
jgi:hypothetical protein